MKKYEENMKKYEDNMKKIWGSGTYKGEAYTPPSSLYKGPGTRKNSELSPYRLWDLEKFLGPPHALALEFGRAKCESS